MGEDKALRKARSKLDKALEGNRHAEAVEALSELRRYEPQNVRWPHKQGDLLRKLGRNAEAVECFEQAVSLYTDQGFIARAVAMAKTVVQLDPARIEILERVDPQAAQQLRAAKRPPRNPMLLLDDAPLAPLPPAADSVLPWSAPAAPRSAGGPAVPGHAGGWTPAPPQRAVAPAPPRGARTPVAPPRTAAAPPGRPGEAAPAARRPAPGGKPFEPSLSLPPRARLSGPGEPPAAARPPGPARPPHAAPSNTHGMPAARAADRTEDFAVPASGGRGPAARPEPASTAARSGQRANPGAPHLGEASRGTPIEAPGRLPLPAAGQRGPQPTAARAAAPPPPPQAFAVTSVAPIARVALRPGATLDQLSLPPQRGQLPPPPPASERMALEEIYSRALSLVPELTIDVNGPANETRFSSAPPRMHAPTLSSRAADPALAALLGSSAALRTAAPAVPDELADFADELALSEAEVSVRMPLPVLESARPEPPAPATLASLPLFPLFAELPRSALSRMIAGSQLIELAHEAHVLRHGDYSDALYGIVDGSVNVVVPGQAFELTLAEGDVFGESVLLEDDRSHADVIVMGQLTALRVPRDVLLDIVQEHPPLAGLVLELLTRRLLGNLLQVSPLFQEFDPATKSELARLFEVRRVAAGTMLAVVGKKMDGLYISLTGTLSVNQPGAPERIAPPGSMFGQNTLLTQDPSQVDVITRVDMIVLRLPSARFSRIAMQYPTMLARLAELSTSEVVRVTI